MQTTVLNTFPADKNCLIPVLQQGTHHGSLEQLLDSDAKTRKHPEQAPARQYNLGFYTENNYSGFKPKCKHIQTHKLAVIY